MKQGRRRQITTRKSDGRSIGGERRCLGHAHARAQPASPAGAPGPEPSLPALKRTEVDPAVLQA